MSLPFRCIILVFVSSLLAHLAQAEVWTLTTADLLTRPVELKAISADAVTVQAPAAGATAIPVDQFVSLRRRIEPRPNVGLTLLLRNGDCYPGEPGPVVGETLTWVSPALGKLDVPIAQLSQISRVAAALTGDPPKQDVATLQSGDTVAGVFGDCQEHKISIQTDGGSTDIPLANLRTLTFAPTAAIATPSNTAAFNVELIDGTRATCTAVTLRADTFAVALAATPAAMINLPVSAVVRVERVNGALSWLSFRTPAEAIQQDYFGGESSWPARFDSAVDGGPLRFQQQLFDHGIGVHAYSKLSFTIDPTWTTFRTQYAIEQPSGRPAPLADVNVRIFADGKLVHERLHFRSGTLSSPVMIKLAGVKTLTLECACGNNGDVQARLDWLQPALTRVSPPGESSKTPPVEKGS